MLLICCKENVPETFLDPGFGWFRRQSAKGQMIPLDSDGLSKLSPNTGYGAANSDRAEGNTRALDALLGQGFNIVDFDAADAAEAGAIRAHLRHEGTPIGPYDVLIAAQARRRGATLVTANTRELARVPGLMVADWAA